MVCSFPELQIEPFLQCQTLGTIEEMLREYIRQTVVCIDLHHTFIISQAKEYNTYDLTLELFVGNFNDGT